MKRIKLFSAVILALSLGIVPFACKEKFLEQTNRFGGDADATFKKAGDVVASVNAIYDTYQNSDLLKKCIWYRANFSSHDFFNQGSDVFWNTYQIPTTFGGLNTFWNRSYIGIARANAALVIIENSRAKGIVDDALAKRLTGECYFLRGMTYYYLAASFGGVPLELNAVSDGLAPRASRDSVFRQVVADMQQAENLLLSKTALPAAELGRATKGAAYGFEGAARMWLKDYTGALAAFNNSELTNNYRLLPSFANVHEYSQQNNDESLFEIQFQLPPNGSQSWDGSWNPPGAELGWIDSFSWPQEITQQGYDYGNPALWNSYQQGDRRKYLTIVGPGDTLQSPGIIAKWGGIKGYIPVVAGFTKAQEPFNGIPQHDSDVVNARKIYTTGINKVDTVNNTNAIINTCGSVKYPWYGDLRDRTGYFCAKKWRDPTLTGNYGNPAAIFGDQNQTMLRYAEILLSRAECKVRTGDIPGAMADIRLVRNRAWGGTAPTEMRDSANYNGTPGVAITDPLQMVLSEYRHELTGEYSLFYNLCRAGNDVAINFIKAANGTVDNTYNPIPNPAPGPTADGRAHGLYNTTPTVNNLLLPIPQGAISLNPNLKQNPGY